MTFIQIKNVIRRSEFLSELSKCRGSKWKGIKRFFIPDVFIREYMPALKIKYGKSKAHDIAVLMMVFSSHSNKEGISFPGYETIMEKSLISNRNTLKNLLRIMDKELNFIEIESGRNKRRSNNYLLIDPKYWKPVNSINLETTVSDQANQQYQSLDTVRTELRA